MNKRIHELAVQIGFPMDYENPAWAYEQSIYKFAELIVQECIDIVPWQYEAKIKEHFGVEE